MVVFCIVVIAFGAWFTANLLAALTRAFR